MKLANRKRCDPSMAAADWLRTLQAGKLKAGRLVINPNPDATIRDLARAAVMLGCELHIGTRPLAKKRAKRKAAK